MFPALEAGCKGGRGFVPAVKGFGQDRGHGGRKPVPNVPREPIKLQRYPLE